MAYNSIPALCDVLQGMDSVRFRGRGRGAAPERTSEEVTCNCKRPNAYVHCNVCRYVTKGRIRKMCPRHPTVSVFTSGFLFLGAFAELRKVDFYLCHVCPSVRVEQLDFHGTDFHEILFQYFPNYVENHKSYY